MATKADFTPDEWKLLLQSPLIAGVAISAADPSGLIGMMKESMASARALVQVKTDPNADALVKAVGSEFETSEGRGLAQDGVKAAITGAKTPAEIVSKALDALKAASAVLDAKGGSGRRAVQDLACRRRQIGRRGRAGRRLSRLRRNPGERSGKGDGGSDRRCARRPGAGRLGRLSAQAAGGRLGTCSEVRGFMPEERLCTGRRNMAGPDPDKPAGEDFSKSLKQLEEESNALKAKIEQERRAHDMPINSNLGDPKWEEKAKDGRFDREEDEDEE